MVNNLQYQLITEKIISQPPLRTGVILLKLRGLDYARGAPIVLLAAIFQHSPLVLISRGDSGIVSPSDMVGKRIMFDSKGSDEGRFAPCFPKPVLLPVALCMSRTAIRTRI